MLMSDDLVSRLATRGVAAATAFFTTVVGLHGVSFSTYERQRSLGQGRPFGASSPFNQPIPSTVKLDRKNKALVRLLKRGDHSAAIEDYGVPVYDAFASTPKRRVPCTKPWGTCPTDRAAPLPRSATPSRGSDAAMVVIDWHTRTVYEYWQYRGSTTSWSTAQPLDGSGRQGGSVGAGVSRLAGLVRTHEISAGHINHALVFSTDMACPTHHRYPATKTDGANLAHAKPCIPEGTRLQLDPRINLDTLPRLTRADKIIGKALQTYGAYAIDNGGARMAIIMEKDVKSSGGRHRVNLGLPWGRLRVLAKQG